SRLPVNAASSRVSPTGGGTPRSLATRMVASPFPEAIRAIRHFAVAKPVVNAGTFHAGEVAAERVEKFREMTLDQVDPLAGDEVHAALHLAIDLARQHGLERRFGERGGPFGEAIRKTEIGVKKMSGRP